MQHLRAWEGDYGPCGAAWALPVPGERSNSSRAWLNDLNAMPSVSVREMRSTDLKRVAELSAQLAAAAEPAAIAARFAAIAAHPPQGLYVAEHAGQVIGWVHVLLQQRLEVDGYAEIGGLVVDTAARRLGAGRALVSRAEQWAREQGSDRLRVRSNVTRVESHAFYPALGFKPIKTQHNYELRF